MSKFRYRKYDIYEYFLRVVGLDRSMLETLWRSVEVRWIVALHMRSYLPLAAAVVYISYAIDHGLVDNYDEKAFKFGFAFRFLSLQKRVGGERITVRCFPTPAVTEGIVTQLARLAHHHLHDQIPDVPETVQLPDDIVQFPSPFRLGGDLRNWLQQQGIEGAPINL
jgi:hypothetical protein